MQGNNTTLNGKQLHEISQKSHSAEVTLLSLAMRDRARSFSDINRTKAKLVKDGEKIVNEDYMQFWKDLQTAGVGSIVYGRKGNPNKFVWHFSLKSVAQVALDGNDKAVDARKPATTIVAKKPKVILRKQQPVKQAAPVTAASDKVIYVPLRKDFDIAIKIPGNISKEELATLHKALDTASA